MRILIPDLAQQDHSSSKIAVSYGLILEEYYMQRRKIQIWLGILAICTSLGTPISTYADTQDVTTNVGDKTTIKQTEVTKKRPMVKRILQIQHLGVIQLYITQKRS